MELLKQRILRDGQVKEGGVLKAVSYTHLAQRKKRSE